MGQFIEELNGVLESGFPGSERLLSQATVAPKVGGFLLWEGFQDKPHTERQRMVWNLLRARLPVEDQQRITAILTLTPLEHTSVLEDDDD